MLKRSLFRTFGAVSGFFRHLPHYVADGANWSLDMDGFYISRGVQESFGVRCPVIKDTRFLPFLRRQVVHFGSQYPFTSGGYKLVHPSNRIVTTFFHGDIRDPDFAPAIKVFQSEQRRISKIIVSCRIMEKRMEEWGIPMEKISRIPIGVDLDIFKPVSPDQKDELRASMGIRPDHVVIGSFQKDGVGWGEGIEPKRVKGPDIFLEVIDRLRKKVPVFVLLTGPSRGFVRLGLEKMGVPYRHDLLDSYKDVARCYHPLDLYLITSREEGGPKAVMESMAAGIPLVSTRVGMAADLIENGSNGFLCDIDDSNALSARCLDVINNESLKDGFREQGLETAKKCDFITVVARRHYEEVYRPLLETY